MDYKPDFHWNEETSEMACILSDGINSYYGIAKCHPDDKDMMSEKTGYEISFRRAKINALRGLRDELKIELKALNRLYYSMNMSKHFNKESYENKMLQRQINLIKIDLEIIKEEIKAQYQSLREYILEKDKFYNKIRTNRAKRSV